MAPTKTKYKKYRTLNIPKPIVDYLLIRLEQNKTEVPLDLSILLSIVNEILSKSNQNRKFEDRPYHIHPLDSRYLKLKYGNRYGDHMRWLTNTSVIWRSEPYKGKTSHYILQSLSYYIEYSNNHPVPSNPYTYCFTKDIEISPTTPISKDVEGKQKNRIYKEWYSIRILITSKNIKHLTYQYEKDSVKINNAAPHIKKMGGYYRKNLEIQYKQAIEHIERYLDKALELAKSDDEINKAYKRYSSRISSIGFIKNGKNNKTLRFTRNKTNNRLDTNLTNMASDLRPFIVGFDDMSYLDLKNSQPVLFNIFLKEYRKNASEKLIIELDRYFELTVTGKWYEFLMKIYGESRDECKEKWMEIAYSENPHYKESKNVFKVEFPLIYDIIRTSKIPNHKLFSIALQKIESQIFIDEICKELVNRKIIPYSMHDGLLVPKANKGETLKVMSDILKNHLGAIPVIKVE